MKKYNFLSFLFFFLTTPFSLLAFSLSSELPIQIEADTAEIFRHSGEAIYQGNVVLQQGENRVTADELKLYRNQEGKISKVLATGEPARYKAQVDAKKSPVFGQAKSILYLPEKEEMILSGNAELRQDNDAFLAPSITYNIGSQVVKSHAVNGQRTTIFIQHLEKGSGKPKRHG